MEDKHGKGRYFALSFSISFFIFTLIFLLFINVVHPMGKTLQVNVNDTVEPAEAFSPQRDDCITVLFMGANADSISPDVYMLVRFNPVAKSVPVIALPPETALMNNGKTEPVREVCEFGGSKYTKECLSKALGIDIDRYIRIDMPGFIQIIDSIGAMEYNIEDEINIGGVAPVVLSKGLQLLDGHKIAGIASAKKQDESLYMISNIAAQYINQRMDIFLSTVVDKVFEKAINAVDSDITYPDYEKRKDAAVLLAGSGTNPSRVIEAAGTWDGDGLFVLSDTFLAEVAREFG